MTVRVVNVITRLIVGGPQQVSLLAARYYRAFAPVEFHLVFGPASGPEGDYHAEIAASGVPHHRLASLGRELSPGADLPGSGRAGRPVPSAPSPSRARAVGQGPAPLAARLARVPVTVQTVHGWSFNNTVDRRRPLFVALERLARRLCDATVLVSRTSTR